MNDTRQNINCDNCKEEFFGEPTWSSKIPDLCNYCSGKDKKEVLDKPAFEIGELAWCRDLGCFGMVKESMPNMNAVIIKRIDCEGFGIYNNRSPLLLRRDEFSEKHRVDDEAK